MMTPKTRAGDLAGRFDASVTLSDVQVNFPGIALGKAYVLDSVPLPEPDMSKRFGLDVDFFQTMDEDAQNEKKGLFREEEIDRLGAAQLATIDTFQKQYDLVMSTIVVEMKGDADKMVEAELYMAMDEESEALKAAKRYIDEGYSAEAAVKKGFEEYIATYQEMAQQERERIERSMKDASPQELEEMEESLLVIEKQTEIFRHQLAVYQYHLSGSQQAMPSLDEAPPGRVIFAKDIPPAVVITSVDPKTGTPKFPAMVASTGSMKGHSAIMATAMGIVFAIAPTEHAVKNGTWVAVDGLTNEIVLQPNLTRRKEFEAQQVVLEADDQELVKQAQNKKSLRTVDGKKIRVLTNFGVSYEVEAVKAVNSSGIGLYRTEAADNLRTSNPITEDEWYNIFKENLLRCSKPDRELLPMTIRTLDIAGDKSGRHGNKKKEQKLAIEIATARKQFAAILRLQNEIIDGRKPNLKVMVPMIRDGEHLAEKQKMMDEEAQRLGFKSMKVGAMAEVPSFPKVLDTVDAANISIGTNDLVHSVLGVDRFSSESKDKYDPTHPAILRNLEDMVKHCEAEKRRGNAIPLSICGDIAADPRFTALIIGAGITDLSSGPKSIPKVKAMVRRIDSREAEALFNAMKNTKGRPQREAMLDRLNMQYGLQPNGRFEKNWQKQEGQAPTADRS